MNWFGWMVVTLWVLGAFINLHDVSLGGKSRPINATISAVGAVVNVLLIFGIFLVGTSS